MLGSGDSVLVLMHVTYLAHLLTVRSLASQGIGGSGSRDYASYQYILICTRLAPRLAPTATAHVHNVLHSETKCDPKNLPDPASNRGPAFICYTALNTRGV